MDREKKNYIDLGVWKGVRALSKEVYLASSQFPSDEKFGLTGQIRRAPISIPQLYLAFDLNFISEINLSVLLEKLETTRKLLNGFIKYYQTLVK